MFFRKKAKKQKETAQPESPPAAEREKVMSAKPVKLYALSTCSHCKSTRRLLDEHQVAYECVEVDLSVGDEREKLVAEVKKFNPACSFPTLVIGDKVIVGFRENEIKETLGI